MMGHSVLRFRLMDPSPEEFVTPSTWLLIRILKRVQTKLHQIETNKLG